MFVFKVLALRDCSPSRSLVVLLRDQFIRDYFGFCVPLNQTNWLLWWFLRILRRAPGISVVQLNVGHIKLLVYHRNFLWVSGQYWVLRAEPFVAQGLAGIFRPRPQQQGVSWEVYSLERVLLWGTCTRSHFASIRKLIVQVDIQNLNFSSLGPFWRCPRDILEQDLIFGFKRWIQYIRYRWFLNLFILKF